MRRIASTAFLVAGLLGTSACTTKNSESTDTWNIGLLLPYTGSSSGTSANFERSAIFAINRVNAAGGIRGKQLRLVAADTHSNLARSVASARELIDAHVTVIIGPESADIAAEVAPLLLDHEVAFLSPLVGAADDSDVTCSDLWFRLAPSARSLGEALAKQLNADSTASAAVLHEAGSYNEEFRDALRSKYVSLGGRVPLALELDPTAQSYNSIVERVIASDVESVVLVTSPRTGALVVNEFDVSVNHPPKWYLSPLLKTDLFVQNVAPSALNGARGVAPDIFSSGEEFPEAFAQRWEGDQPLEGAYFYYDAAALVAFALQSAKLDEDGELPVAEFKRAVRKTAGPPGEDRGWNQLEKGLKNILEGRQIYYSGLTGPMLLNDCGARQSGAYSTWTVKSGKIVNGNGE